MPETIHAQAIITAAEQTHRRPTPARTCDQATWQKMLRRQRTALTRAENTKDPVNVVRACRTAVREWEASGIPWPDHWHTWNIALGDALLALRIRPVALEDLTGPEWDHI